MWKLNTRGQLHDQAVLGLEKVGHFLRQPEPSGVDQLKAKYGLGIVTQAIRYESMMTNRMRVELARERWVVERPQLARSRGRRGRSEEKQITAS